VGCAGGNAQIPKPLIQTLPGVSRRKASPQTQDARRSEVTTDDGLAATSCIKNKIPTLKEKKINHRAALQDSASV
jgi:ribosomal protein L32